jgi:benzoate/toluate 1,2-dioxygenase subunit beta
MTMATGQSTKKRKAAAKPGSESVKRTKTTLRKNSSGSAAHQRIASAQEANAPAAADTHTPQHAIEQFLYAQAESLDGKRWQDYIDLFTDDGHYWMPAAPEQTTGEGVPSIFYEDKNLMQVRMRRVQHPDAWSQRPLWGTNHLVSNVIVESENRKKGELVVRSRFHMMEFRRETSRHFGGSYVHHLVRTPDGFRIRLQRVDMVNAQGPFEYVLQIWV